MYEVEIAGVRIKIERTEGLFSPRGADWGTLAMLRHAVLPPDGKVLDLGCGCGLVGIYACCVCGEERVTLCDIDPAAVLAARENARLNGFCPAIYESDGLSGVPDAGYDVILSNPPYQSDFAVAKRFIEKGFNRLKIGGTMYMVTKRRPWYENKLRAVFGGCRVTEDDGYFVFAAQKRAGERNNTKDRRG